MSINDRTLITGKCGIWFITLAFGVACSGNYEQEGQAESLAYNDEPVEEVVVAQQSALLEQVTEDNVLGDPNHSQEELDEYRAYLDAYGPDVVEKAGGSCGSRNSFGDQVTTSLIPPDHFPPDSIVSLPITAITGLCVLWGVADFHSAGCDVHDVCYATPGRSKTSCDLEFIDNLKDECNDTYDGWLAGGCRKACRAVADVMGAAVIRFGQDAYDNAQASPIGNSAPPREPDPACVASCQDNCLYLQYDQIGMCQYSCPDACR